MSLNSFINSLNKQQKKAVLAPREPALIIAGPGTGKTRTLIGRIAWQIHKYHIPAPRVLALTFSNKAAQEMRSRLTQLLQSEAGKVYISTIHAFCLDVLKKYPEKAGLRSRFTVADEEYTGYLLKRLLRDQTMDKPDVVMKGVKAAFGQYLIQGKPLPPFSARIYEKYQAYLHKHNLIDYDQILARTAALFRKESDVLEQYRFMYQAIHVDEFQDTDATQYQIIRMLAAKHLNIFVVADDDQSIYAWRGANPENIRHYMRDFKIEKPIVLDINYRSGPKIISTATQMVSDTDRIEPDKTLIPGTQVAHEHIRAHFFDYETQEQQFIIESIRHWKEQGVPYNDMAVLYPRHKFSEGLALRMLQENIPFQQARKALADNVTLKRLVLFLRLTNDALDDVSWQALTQELLGFDIDKHVEWTQKKKKLGYRRALYVLSRDESLDPQVRRQIGEFMSAAAHWVNLKTFYTFEQLVDDILGWLRRDANNVINENLTALADIRFPDALYPDDRHMVYVWHEHSEIRWLARQMCERVWPGRVEIVIKEQLPRLRNAFVIALSEWPDGQELARGIELYHERFCKGRSVVTALLRYLQQAVTPERPLFRDYVVLDLETTGRDVETCGIVEIAAVRVREGKIVDRFETLVNPEMPVEEGARKVHGIDDARLKEAPLTADVWPAFRAFIGDDVLVAHNGFAFDFIILNRHARLLDGARLSNVLYDSLTLARRLYPAEGNSIDALAERFQIDPGERHRALADVEALQQIFEALMRVDRRQQAKRALEPVFEHTALAIYHLQHWKNEEDRIYFLAGAPRLLSPYSKLAAHYAEQFVVDPGYLKGALQKRLDELRPGYSAFDEDQVVIERMREWVRQLNDLPMDEAMGRFLNALALVDAQDNLTSLDAVSLLTFHAAKGLEFRKVIIIGMEDDHMPSFFAKKETDPLDERSTQRKMDEQKRLLYVGMTRAKEELFLCAVKNRNGREQTSSPFLRQIVKSLNGIA